MNVIVRLKSYNLNLKNPFYCSKSLQKQIQPFGQMWVVSANHHFGLVSDRESVSVPAGRQQLQGYRQRYPRTQQHALGPQSTGLAPPFGGSV